MTYFAKDDELTKIKKIALIQSIHVRDVNGNNCPGNIYTFWRNKLIAKEVMADFGKFKFFWMMSGIGPMGLFDVKALIEEEPKTRSRMIDEELASIAWEMYHKLDILERDDIFGPQVAGSDKITSVWSGYSKLSEQEKQALFA